MRRGVTVLVVVVVAAIALAAGLDALRGEGSPGADSEVEAEFPSVSTTEPEVPTDYVPLEDELAGTLYYTNENCELQAIELPRTQPTEAPAWNECRFALSPDGESVAPASSAWDPYQRRGRFAQFEKGSIRVSTDGGPVDEPFEGMAPAWRPDGTLTYFGDGAVRDWPSGDVVLSRREIVRALRSQLFEAAGVEVKEAAWMRDDCLALIVALERPGEPDRDVVTIFEEHRLAGVGSGSSRSLSDLRASPQGNFVAVRSPPSFELFLPDGRRAGVPPLLGLRAIAFSPDERWTAAATDTGVYVFRPGSQEWTARMDLDANDLAWLGPAGPPPLAKAKEAKDWLRNAGATGRLFVTDPDCRLRALVLPNLVWEWKAEPDAPLAPCRFNLTSDEVAAYESIALQPQGELRAYCEGDDLDVYTPGTSEETVFANACAPAWTPSGRLTFLREGELYAGELDGGERLLISRDDLREMFGREVALEEVAWADDQRLWAVVRTGENAIVGAMTTSRLVHASSFTTRRIEGLRISASGSMVAARTDRGIVFIRGGGRRPLVVGPGRAVAWAPDNVIAAVATPREIIFVKPISRETVTLPLRVRDLEWVVP